MTALEIAAALAFGALVASPLLMTVLAARRRKQALDREIAVLARAFMRRVEAGDIASQTDRIVADKINADKLVVWSGPEGLDGQS